MNGAKTSWSGYFASFAWWLVCALLVASVTLAAGIPTTRHIGRLVDATLERVGDKRRIADALPHWGGDGRAALAGKRYSLKNNQGHAIVFSAAGSGVAASFVALYHPQRGIDLVVPLDADSGDASSRLPPGLMELHLSRIVAAEEKARDERSPD
jgi:hypothetical protein